MVPWISRMTARAILKISQVPRVVRAVTTMRTRRVLPSSPESIQRLEETLARSHAQSVSTGCLLVVQNFFVVAGMVSDPPSRTVSSTNCFSFSTSGRLMLRLCPGWTQVLPSKHSIHRRCLFVLVLMFQRFLRQHCLMPVPFRRRQPVSSTASK